MRYKLTVSVIDKSNPAVNAVLSRISDHMRDMIEPDTELAIRVEREMIVSVSEPLSDADKQKLIDTVIESLPLTGKYSDPEFVSLTEMESIE